MVEAEALLAKYVPLANATAGKDITVERTAKLMEHLGNPHKHLKIVHVAGTSGKTSTVYFIANLLMHAGKKVGVTVSPHVDTVRERVQINLRPLFEAEFVAALNRFMKLVETSPVQPTYFELMVGFAYWFFAEEGVDYAVVETGMGGLHDGTNVADNPDKVCVITDIGLDHMHVLGKTPVEIARQKAGIIHPRNEVFMHEQPEEIMQVFDEQCDKMDAYLNIAMMNSEAEQSDMPDFQKRNWSLAYAVFEYLQERDILSRINPKETMQLTVPGRMDLANVGGKTVIMDGAHNEQKTKAFVDSFRLKYPNTKVPVLLSLKRGKELAAVLPLLKPITSKLIVTTFQMHQDLPISSIDAQELSVAATKLGFDNVTTEPSQSKAYQVLLKSPGKVAIITGSFYLIGQLRGAHPELKTK